MISFSLDVYYYTSWMYNCTLTKRIKICRISRYYETKRTIRKNTLVLLYKKTSQNQLFIDFTMFYETSGIRTPDNLIKSQVLYHLSYTPIFSFPASQVNWASWIRTSECRSQSPVPYRLAIAQKGGYRDSNPGPPEPQSGALTNCAIPTIFYSFHTPGLLSRHYGLTRHNHDTLSYL